MKYTASTPSLLSSSVVEAKEWPSKYDPKSEKLRFGTVSNAPRDRTASSNSLSCFSSSESSSTSSSPSVEFKSYYDDADDSAESTNSIGEDEPILSFETLSLDTLRITPGVATKPMNSPQEQQQDIKDPLIKAVLSFSEPEKDGDHTCNMNSLSTANTSLLSDTPSLAPPSFPQDESKLQRRTRCTKKYTLRTSTNATPSSTVTEIYTPKPLRTKRHRGGSDFSMTSATAADHGTNSSSNAPSRHRKRRRTSRNRAMGAGDFDLIFSQINALGPVTADCKGLGSTVAVS